MSWQLGAFTILALGLAGGFAWYERTRPDARIVALVATLAAFAALGRIAFAALPNVKPTTDIVLISGYALGGGPGFVVGALAGLTSNFFFGQGPWTPWQMAAWGLTGVIGAGLALPTRGRIGRWPLALSCAAVGFAFTVVQDVGDWFTYSDHSLAQLGVYVGKGIGFDGVHAAGCLVFALAFGPALLRSISRFAARLQVRWQSAAPLACALAGLTVLLGVGTGGAARAASGPTSYLLSAQNGDGGFGPSPGQSSSQLISGWAALGLAAEGYNPQDVSHGGSSLIDYIGSSAPSDIGSLERTILVVRAAGLPATSLVAQLEQDVRGDGSVSEQTNLTSFAILALRAAGVSPPPNTVGWLLRQQDSDGGFNFATAGSSSDVDDTGAALEALGSNARAVSFILGQQNPDGGFPANPGGDSNAQSTAWAVQGLLAAGAGGTAVERAIAYLNSLVAADGHVQYSRGNDQTPVWVTGQALMALARKPLPLAPVGGHGGGHRGGSRQGHGTGWGGRSAGSTPHRRSRRGARAATPNLDRLATDAGLAFALALAPVGVD